MRLKAGAVAGTLVVGTTFVYVGPASAQQPDGVNCEHVPTQIDISNSILRDLDSTDLDRQRRCGLRGKQAGAPNAYDLTRNPPVLLEPEPEPEPPPAEPAPVAEPAPEPEATLEQPVQAEPSFTGQLSG
jgi:hypothetical protein